MLERKWSFQRLEIRKVQPALDAAGAVGIAPSAANLRAPLIRRIDRRDAPWAWPVRVGVRAVGTPGGRRRAPIFTTDARRRRTPAATVTASAMPTMAEAERTSPDRRPVEARTLNLALQGGGAHGAFTWGVLDRLFEDGRFAVEGISGTSAGAMNAAVVAYGLAKGGAQGARDALADFWDRIAAAACLSPLQPSLLDRWLSVGNMDFSPAWMAFDNLSRLVSPYEFNRFNVNPLRRVLTDVVDFEWLAAQCAQERVKLFLSATTVRNGKIKVFSGAEISAQAVMASACLPFMFQAVAIDGEDYWDGGYMGNPPIYPLIYHTRSRDVLLVQINPVNIDATPRTAPEIFDRINEISFNSSLMRELRAIAFVTKLIDDGHLDPERYKRMNLHLVEAEAALAEFNVSSKLNADRAFLRWLFRLGRERAGLWLDAHADKVGCESSLQIADFV